MLGRHYSTFVVQRYDSLSGYSAWWNQETCLYGMSLRSHNGHVTLQPFEFIFRCEPGKLGNSDTHRKLLHSLFSRLRRSWSILCGKDFWFTVMNVRAAMAYGRLWLNKRMMQRGKPKFKEARVRVKANGKWGQKLWSEGKWLWGGGGGGNWTEKEIRKLKKISVSA